ncbi:MAG: DUF6899 family protein [bacterium]
MPYINPVKRKSYDQYLDPIPFILTKGDLEYVIFKVLKKYMSDKDYRYCDLHDCVYACQHAADEFRRRYLDKREDEAREQNGDIE